MQRTIWIIAGLTLGVGCGGGTDENSHHASELIGPEGGTVGIDGEVTLTVPPGALSSPQTLSITRTSDAAPAGYLAHSPIYRFEPRGLEFDSPVRVTITIREPSSRAGVIWTTRSDTSWERIESSLSGLSVTGLTRHFSHGFAGENTDGDVDAGIVDEDANIEEEDAGIEDTGVEDTGVEDTGVEDTGVEDTGVEDTGIVDADTGTEDTGAVDSGYVDPVDSGMVACPNPTVIEPGTTVNSLNFSIVSRLEAGPCGMCPDEPTAPSRVISSFTIRADMQITTWFSHRLLFDGMRLDLAECGAVDEVCVASAHYPQIITRRLSPGTYQVVGCGEPQVVIEPPPSAPTNTSCSTAASLGMQRRVTGTDSLFYTFDLPVTGAYEYVSVRSEMHQGSMRLSLRSGCDSTTEIASDTVPYVPAGERFVFPIGDQPVGRYYVVATEVSPGLEFEIYLTPR